MIGIEKKVNMLRKSGSLFGQILGDKISNLNFPKEQSEEIVNEDSMELMNSLSKDYVNVNSVDKVLEFRNKRMDLKRKVQSLT